MSIFLDTNALPRRGMLLNLVMSSLLRVANHHGLRVCVSEVVLHEAINGRKEQLREAVEELQRAIRATSKLVPDLSPVYLPDPDADADRWRQELEEKLVIVPLTGEDAVEALRRESLRIVPATEGRGARDAAIWLTAVRHHREHQESTFFISADGVAFCEPGSSTELSSDLVEDLAREGEGFNFFRSVNELLGHLAEPLDSFSLDVNTFAVWEEEFFSDLMQWGLLTDLSQKWSLEETPESNDVTLTCEELVVKKAYQVDDLVLALVGVSVMASILASDISTWVQVSVWTEFDPDIGGITSVEVEGLF